MQNCTLYMNEEFCGCQRLEYLAVMLASEWIVHVYYVVGMFTVSWMLQNRAIVVIIIVLLRLAMLSN